MNQLGIKSEFVIGDKITWKDCGFQITDPDTGELITASSSTHTLSYSLRGATALDVTATASGSEWLSTISSVQSATLTPGVYYFQVYLTDLSGDRTRVGQGQITVIANLAAVATTYDDRSDAEQMLDAVNTAIKARLSGGAVDSYSIRGRNLSRTPLPELFSLRDRLKSEVSRERAAEKIAQGLGDPRRLWVRFGGPQ